MTALPEFGYTRWGADIVRIAEPLSTSTPNQAAPLARRLARHNSAALTVDGRLVKALVHRASSASVAHLEFAPMAPATADALREILSTGSPDDDMHRRATDSGQRPGPVLDNCDCSCKARSTFCVHVLAALYALAAAVDQDPAIALSLQDFGAQHAGAPPGDADGPPPRWVPLSSVDVATFYG